MSIDIILADDHKLFLDGLKSILTREIGMNVVATASNGIELMDIMGKHVPHILLTDIRMPIMDGISITKHIKKKYPRTHIIGLSMFDQEDDVVEMLDAGAKGYLVKNVDKEELVMAIHQVAKGNYYLSSRFEGVFKRWSAKEVPDPKIKLTRRERQILVLLARGKTSQQMAKALHLSRFTVDTHRKNIHKKLGIKSNLALAREASKYMDSS